MKSFGFFIACFLFLYNEVEAKERIIEKPSFIAWSSDVLEIDKIILNDTASILHVKAFFQPKYWLKLHSSSYLLGDDGQKYMLCSTQGIMPDTEFIMPESGERDFTLVFPPLPDTVGMVSFFGENDEDVWKIWGIRLKGKPYSKLDIPEGISDKKYTVLDTLPEPGFISGNALLTGKLLDFLPSMDRKFNIQTMSVIGEDAAEIEVEIENDGSFSIEIPLISVTPATIRIFDAPINIFLAPGEETNVYINTREICRRSCRLRKKEKSYGDRIYYDKFMAGVLNDLEKYPVNTSVVTDYYTFFDEIENKSMVEVKELLLDNYRKIMDEINGLKISGASKEVLKNRADNSAVYHICSAPMLVKQAYAISNKLNDEEIARYFATPVCEPYGFYDVLKEFESLNKPQALYAENYSSILRIPDFDKLYSRVMEIDKGTYFDCFTVNKILRSIDERIPLTERQKLQLMELSFPAFFKLADQKNEELLASIEKNKKETHLALHAITNINKEDLIPFLLSEFRGKVVLIDFWATWCGPCLLANKMMKPMKDEINDKDIVYLYLTGENSPENKWENIKSDISGVHLRLSNDQWNYLCEEFDVSGIPAYLIIDRRGNITYRKVGFPGVAVIKTELENLLAKE